MKRDVFFCYLQDHPGTLNVRLSGFNWLVIIIKLEYSGCRGKDLVQIYTGNVFLQTEMFWKSLISVQSVT